MQPRLLLLPFLLSSLPALAVTFQTRLESVEWKVEGDQFECRLSQPVANFGVGEFVRRAGEQATFRLKPEAQWLGRGSATLLAAAPPWRPGQGDINLGQVSIGSGEVPFNSSQQQAGRLLTGLLEGRSPLVRHRTWQGDRLEVRLLPARFASVYSQYQACIAKLLPVNFEQVKLAQVGFPDGGTALNDVARAKLDIILQLLKADPSINRIELDGHSDNSGNRLTNRDLSRRRALAVQEYLKSNGGAGKPDQRALLRRALPAGGQQQRRQPCAQPPGHRAPVARGGGRAGDGSAEGRGQAGAARGRTCRTEASGRLASGKTHGLSRANDRICRFCV
ncbi:OmpA family membrane protein [Pseudomonas aeruginosa]|nr:OmpA family membrane protein [Pseudomonas aeruginosa]